MASSGDVPNVFKDFIFDLYQSSRVSLFPYDVAKAYDMYKDICDRVFPQAPLPDSAKIAGECNSDKLFLLFYREMVMRHKVRNLKSNVHDMVESWNLYIQLFNSLNNSAEEFVMSSLWISDILQEFVYQFQGFCQYRSLGNHRPDDVTILEANRAIWDMSVVVKILRDFVTAGTTNSNASEFGKFALVELARLECLTGEFSTSLKTLTPASLTESMESVTRYPLSKASIFYHAGVCHLMLHQYAACIDMLSSYLLSANALRPTSKGSGSQNQLQKTQDRCLGLIALAVTLCPYCRIDDQVKEALDSKYGDKMKRVTSVDSGLRDLFESCCPKFISTTVPATFTSGENLNQITFDRIVATFVEGAKDGLQSLKVLKYLRLYSSIEISKLSKYCDCQDADTLRYLELIKLNTAPTPDCRSICDGAKLLELHYQWQANTRVDFSITDGVLRSYVAPSRAIRASNIQAFYVGSIKKQMDIANNVTSKFATYGF